MTVLKEIRVLVIEDNAGDFFLVQEYLSVSTPRFTITRASALKEALRILEGNLFDVILLDLSLPDSSGLRSVTAIIGAASSIPLLVFTGFNEEQYGMDSLKLGAQDYLVKDEISSSLLIKSILYSIERSQVRRQIFRQERLFRIITENSIDAKFLLDDQGEVTFCTPSVLAITGYTSNECIGQHQSFFIHPDDMPLFLTCIDMVKQDPKHYPVLEVRIRQKDSDYIWCRKTIVNLLQEEYVNAIVCTFWDISGEKESKEILEASEERYRYLFNNNPAVIVIWDPQSFEIAQVNLAAVQQYGYSRTEFLSKSVLDLRAPEDIPLIKELSAAALQDDQFKKTAVWRHLDKHGQEMFMQISSHSIVYNKKRSVLSIAINITEKLMLEKKLEL
ncbi:MAG TPA: PAS domain S-box protein, partial [Chitinophagaceae bacterium]|nr:PAS domain S-box protein [Chitinophagaceae bacterium]